MSLPGKIIAIHDSNGKWFFMVSAAYRPELSCAYAANISASTARTAS